VRGAGDTANEAGRQAEALGAAGVVPRFQGIADRAGDLERMLLAGIEAGERSVAQLEAIRHGGAPVPATAAGGGSGAPEPGLPRVDNGIAAG